MATYDIYMTEDARLVILKELAQQPNVTLNDTILQRVLESFGHNRTREWVRTQILKLAELGAVRTTPAGTVLVATLTQAGQDHVLRRTFIDGVAKPSLEA